MFSLYDFRLGLRDGESRTGKQVLQKLSNEEMPRWQYPYAALLFTQVSGNLPNIAPRILHHSATVAIRHD
jgi:hypothetical protein